jgi:hypothetical protein
MIGRLFTAASTVSLAICLTILAMWCQSGRVVADHVVLGTRDGRLWECTPIPAEAKA